MEAKVSVVALSWQEGANIVVGQSHFIKTVEDVYEAIVNTVPQMKFGVAFNEASGPCLIRVDGNDEALKELAAGYDSDGRGFELREVAGDRECRDELRQAGVPVIVKASGDLMHLKSYLVDGYLLRTGSANASKSGERFQDNDLVVISDRAAADGFKANFEMLWNRPGNSD